MIERESVCNDESVRECPVSDVKRSIFHKSLPSFAPTTLPDTRHLKSDDPLHSASRATVGALFAFCHALVVKGVPTFERIVDRTVIDVAKELKADRAFGDQVIELTADLWNRVVAQTGDVVILEEHEVIASPAHYLLFFFGGAALVPEEDIERAAHQARAQRKQSFHHTEGVGNFQIGHNEEQCLWLRHSQFRASGVQLHEVFHRPDFIFAERCSHIMDSKAMLRCKLLDGATNVMWIQGIVCMRKVCFDRLLPPSFRHGRLHRGVDVDWVYANAAVEHGRSDEEKK